MIPRALLLVVTGYLGCVAFYSRVEPSPRALLPLAARKTLYLTLWIAAAFALMSVVEYMAIDPPAEG
ncbi:MAG: hypothetical protein R3F30_08890 [Planctomycetota bacterium]